MPRMQVYLPDGMYQQVKARGLPVSELLKRLCRPSYLASIYWPKLSGTSRILLLRLAHRLPGVKSRSEKKGYRNKRNGKPEIAAFLPVAGKSPLMPWSGLEVKPQSLFQLR